MSTAHNGGNVTWRRIFIRRSHRIYILLPTLQVCPSSAFLMYPWEIEIRWLVWGVVIRGRAAR